MHILSVFYCVMQLFALNYPTALLSDIKYLLTVNCWSMSFFSLLQI